MTVITSARDGSQQVFAASVCGLMRCYSQQFGDADRITTGSCFKSLIARWFNPSIGL